MLDQPYIKHWMEIEVSKERLLHSQHKVLAFLKLYATSLAYSMRFGVFGLMSTMLLMRKSLAGLQIVVDRRLPIL